MAIALTQFQSSDLSRNPLPVFTAAETSPVLVTRRDGEDFILMTAREAEARVQLLELAAQLIAVTSDERGTLAERMANIFSWMLALSPSSQTQCADDLVKAARASFATGKPHLAIAEITAWRETAIAVAEGLDLAPAEWLTKPEPVQQPV